MVELITLKPLVQIQPPQPILAYGMLIVLHAIIKKMQKTSAEGLALARQRLKLVQSWQERTYI